MSAEIIAIGDKTSASVVKHAVEAAEPDLSARERSLALNYAFAVGMMEYAQESMLEAADMVRAAAQTLNWLAILAAATTSPPFPQARPLSGR